jgi:hypothetical protein
VNLADIRSVSTQLQKLAAETPIHIPGISSVTIRTAGCMHVCSPGNIHEPWRCQRREVVSKLHGDHKVCFHQLEYSYFLISITNTKGLSRPACTTGYQRRSDTTAFSSSYYFISITCLIHLVPLFVFNIILQLEVIQPDNS